MHPAGRDLGQRDKGEGAVLKAWMRQNQFRRREALLVGLGKALGAIPDDEAPADGD